MEKPRARIWIVGSTLPALLAAALVVAGQAAPGALMGGAVTDRRPVADAGAVDTISGAPRCRGGDSGGPLAADSSLHCVALVPHPDVRSAGGAAELLPGPGPFTVSVTADGRLRHRIVMRLEGLPPPDSLGPYGSYVAWAMPPSMEPVVRLGEVGNGTSDTATIALDRFLLLVTAEPSSDVETRSGPSVLRGFSPGMQMADTHFMGGGSPPGMEGDRGVGAETREPGEAGGETEDRGWRPPPMNPRVSPMPMPGVAGSTPPVEPYLPEWEIPVDSVPRARSRRVVDVPDGDTIRLEAGPVRRRLDGRRVVQLAFNGQLPGPLVRVREGTTIYAEFVNRTGWPGTVHWHGVRLENPFDGVPGVTQELVRAGESFLYRIRFPDAGVYWYHPHHREDLLQDLGLFGNILVSSEEADYYGPAHRDEVLTLDDLLVGDAGLVPFGTERATHAVMGRFGNRLLVNGDTDYELEVERGEVVRFHLTNVSNVRTFNLSFGGAPMKVVASDVGRFQREEAVESVVLAPAERYVVEVRFPEPGSYALTNRFHAVDHGSDAFFAATDTLGVVRVGPATASPRLDDAFDRSRSPDAVEREVEQVLRGAVGAPRKELVLTMESRGLPFSLERIIQQESRSYVHPVEWTGTMPRMSWLPTADQVRWILREPSTGRENEAIEWDFEVGDLVRIRIHNDRRSLHPMQHPIHIHGQRFLVLAVNGVPEDNLAWKDTVLIPAGGTVDLLLELSNPGAWMLHCHISEHLEGGMKLTFDVEGKDPLAEEGRAPVQ
jgi:FtsP/CotA-like multicopper oxidase with cupredoxin domain